MYQRNRNEHEVELLKLFIGHTYADVKDHYQGKKRLLLVAWHRLDNVLMHKPWEFRTGLEEYYFSPQQHTGGSSGKAFGSWNWRLKKQWEGIFPFFWISKTFLMPDKPILTLYLSGVSTSPPFRDYRLPWTGSWWMLESRFNYKILTGEEQVEVRWYTGFIFHGVVISSLA